MSARKKRWIVTYEVPIMVYVEATNEEKAEAAADAIYFDHDGEPGVWTALDTVVSGISRGIGRDEASVTFGTTYDDATVEEQP